MFRKILLVAIAITSSLLAFRAAGLAAIADLDPLFGIGGKVVTNFTSVGDRVRRMQLLPSGKVLVLTTSTLDGIGAPGAATIFCFNRDGSSDLTWGTQGRISLNGLRDFAVLPDGRLILISTVYLTGGAATDISRFSANGSSDNTFTQTRINGADRHEGRRVKIDHSGRIIVAGATEQGSTFIARLHPNGGFDTTFGYSGVTYGWGIDFSYTIIGGSGEWTVESTGDILPQTDGKIVYATGGGWNNSVYLSRANADGSPDMGFGENGLVTIPVFTKGYPYDTFVFGLNQFPGGDILLSGTAFHWYGTTSYASIVRVRQNGSLAPGFGQNGIVTLSANSRGPASAVLPLSSNKVLVGGMKNSTFALTRLNENGSLDPSFGDNGAIVTPIGTPSSTTTILDMAMQPDGKLVVAGSSQDVVALARYSDVDAVNRRARFDYDGDGSADVSVRRGENSTWYLKQTSAGYTAMDWGITGDRMVPADYDGDGKTDVAVFRPTTGQWFLVSSSTGIFQTFTWGQDGDLPVPMDRNGDGKADLIVFRPSTRIWFSSSTISGPFEQAHFGSDGDKPVLGDFDADGRDDIAVFRPSNGNWYILRSSLGFLIQTWGQPGDIPVPADFDGDGRTDQAVFRPATGQWFLNLTSSGFTSRQWGQTGDIPTAADYDGDGKADLAIFRPSNGGWYIVNSTRGIQVEQFGQTGDTPTPSSLIY